MSESLYYLLQGGGTGVHDTVVNQLLAKVRDSLSLVVDVYVCSTVQYCTVLL